jgi:hypothetical protein
MTDRTAGMTGGIAESFARFRNILKEGGSSQRVQELRCYAGYIP